MQHVLDAVKSNSVLEDETCGGSEAAAEHVVVIIFLCPIWERIAVMKELCVHVIRVILKERRIHKWTLGLSRFGSNGRGRISRAINVSHPSCISSEIRFIISRFGSDVVLQHHCCR